MFLYANLLFAHIKDFNFFSSKMCRSFLRYELFTPWRQTEFLHLVGALKALLCQGFGIFYQKRIFVFVTLLMSFGFKCVPISINRAIPLRKCYIKALDEWRSSVYILIETCSQRSKWLDLKLRSMPQKYIYLLT